MKNFEQNQEEDFDIIYKIFNSITDYVIVINRYLEIEYINEVIHLKKLGYDWSDLIGNNLKDFIKPENLRNFYETLQKILHLGRGTLEFQIRNKKNRYIWLEAKIKVFKGSDDDEKALLICRDISKRKIYEEKLREREELYKILVRTSPDAIILTDLKGKIVELSQYALTLSGFEDATVLIGKSALNFISPEDRNKAILNFENTLKEEEVTNVKYKFLKKDGSSYIGQLNGSVIKDSNGKPKGFLGTIRDLTEKFNLENKLKESEEKYRHLFETSPFAIILTDKKGYIVDCNSATESLIGYNKIELIGKRYGLISFAQQKYLPDLIKQRKFALKRKILRPLDIQLYKKDGALIWAEVKSSLVKISRKELIQILGFDITKRKMAENLVKEETKKLKDLDKMRKDIISRVSHEIKTPLMSVSGATELLLTAYRDQVGEDALELIKMIENGGKRLSTLVENLINVSRIEFNKIVLNKKLNNLKEIIIECTNELSLLIEKRNLSLNLYLLDNTNIKIDKLRIEQVVMNLLMNAIKNSPPKGKIYVFLRKTNYHAEIKIKDMGVGLTEDEMEKIFTRFGKLERYGPGLEYLNIQGSGLGLFISKEIINLHGGQIWAESEGRHKGATFIVKLPISRSFF